VAEQKIPKAKGEEAEQLYSRYFNRLKHDKSMMAAADEASQLTIAKLKADAANTRRAQLLQAKAGVTLIEDMKSFRGGMARGGQAPQTHLEPDAARALATNDDRARYMYLEGQKLALHAQDNALLDKVLVENRATLTGRMRNPALEKDILFEAYGRDTGNLNAKEMAAVLQNVAEIKRQRFNEAGGHIGKRDDWHWVQKHGEDPIAKAGYDQWHADVTSDALTGRPLLKAEAMLSDETGLPLLPDELEPILRKMYQDVTTGGRANMNIGGINGKALYNSHAEARFFVFNGPEEHWAYMQKYGGAGAVESMLHHFERMDTVTAAMQRYGPNPPANIKLVSDTMIQEAAQQTGFAPRVPPQRKTLDPRRISDQFANTQADRAYAASRYLKDTYEVYMGSHQNMIPVNAKIAQVFQVERNFEVATKLGSAFWSAMGGDMATQLIVRKFNGLPVKGLMTDYFRMMAPTADSLEMRQSLIRQGAIGEDWQHSTIQATRAMLEDYSGEKTKRLAETTMRGSVMLRHTDVNRQSFLKSFTAALTDNRLSTYEQLPGFYRRMLDRNGIDAPNWDKIRATPLTAERGTMWLSPVHVEEQGLRDALLRAAHNEKRFSVPEPGLRTRTQLITLAPSGNYGGEMIKGSLLFKSFGLEVLNSHYRRALQMENGWHAAGYAATVSAALITSQYFIDQIKNILLGKDPEPPNAHSLGSAIASSGSAGILTDLVAAGSGNTMQGGTARYVAGPLGSTAADILSATAGNAYHAYNDEPTHFATDATKALKTDVPVASSLWYIKPIWNHLVVQAFDGMVNPNHDRHVASMIRNAEKQKSPYYWNPDEALPHRAPDFSNALPHDAPDLAPE
jgi:hypothetical protein